MSSVRLPGPDGARVHRLFQLQHLNMAEHLSGLPGYRRIGAAFSFRYVPAYRAL